jgi:hypothetical protein
MTGSEVHLELKSQSYFTTGGLPPNIWSWLQASWDSRPALIFQLNRCGHSPYVRTSVTRGWVCRLQLLLALASAVILKSESLESHDHILLSHFRDYPNLAGLRWMYSTPPPHGMEVHLPSYPVFINGALTYGNIDRSQKAINHLPLPCTVCDIVLRHRGKVNWTLGCRGYCIL